MVPDADIGPFLRTFATPDLTQAPVNRRRTSVFWESLSLLSIPSNYLQSLTELPQTL